ncbi:C-C motif chemokine 25 [Choloepus didactylus]|uniref:C-C motif chemokine 25 n=1 Tax=Choloepus didactylus TaxID=27675 RepID=UPI0018A0093C|nr:C-C motif chemokine 25 [Choloepus didactylus]XP_037680423.1 C-C motif chemokine 25 [Choloepus didactylus]
MNPLLLACLVACFVGAWAPVVHSQGPSEDCCLAYHPHARWAVLRHAQGYTRQEVSGSCNLPAVIFFFPRRHKMVCGNPQDMWVRNGMRRLDARSKISSKVPKNSWKTLQGSHLGQKKLTSETSRLPFFKYNGPSKSSKRNSSLLP